MEFELYEEIALAKDLLDSPYKRFDLASIIEIHNEENRTLYTIEFYDSQGQTLNEKIVNEIDIMKIPKNTIVCIRNLI